MYKICNKLQTVCILQPLTQNKLIIKLTQHFKPIQLRKTTTPQMLLLQLTNQPTVLIHLQLMRFKQLIQICKRYMITRLLPYKLQLKQVHLR